MQCWIRFAGSHSKGLTCTPFGWWACRGLLISTIEPVVWLAAAKGLINIIQTADQLTAAKELTWDATVVDTMLSSYLAGSVIRVEGQHIQWLSHWNMHRSPILTFSCQWWFTLLVCSRGLLFLSEASNRLAANLRRFRRIAFLISRGFNVNSSISNQIAGRCTFIDENDTEG